MKRKNFWDHVETAVLFGLIALALYLSSILYLTPMDWAGGHRIAEKDTSSESIAPLLVPAKTLINFSDGDHTVSFDYRRHNLWDDAKPALANLFSATKWTAQDLSQEEYLAALNRPSVVFGFSVPLKKDLMGNTMTKSYNQEPFKSIQSITAIYVYLGDGDAHFILTDEKHHYLKIYGTRADASVARERFNTIAAEKNYPYYYSMKQSLGVDSAVFLPYEMDLSLPRPRMRSVYKEMDPAAVGDMAARVLDSPLDRLRLITESGGGVLYVLGQRVVKIDSRGIMTYREPLPETTGEPHLYQSLQAAMDFMAVLYEEDYRLIIAQIQPVVREDKPGYRMSFRTVVNGMPVILANREMPSYVDMTVIGDRVVEYRDAGRRQAAFASVPLESKVILPAFKVLDRNFDTLKRVYEQEYHHISPEEDPVETVLEGIEDISMGYLDRELYLGDTALSPIWIVTIGERMLCFDAYEGSLLFEK